MVSFGRRLTLAISMVALVAACATQPGREGESTGGATTGTGGRAGSTTAAGTGTAASGAAADAQSLQGYMDLAYDKLDQGAIAESILNFVTVLSELDRAPDATEDARRLGTTAEEELTRIGSALDLAASTEWFDASKNQISASTLDIGTPRALNPAVTLTYSFGGTRTVVGGAPVSFVFVEGSGSLVTPVTTNEFGQANTTVTSLDNPNAESKIKAAVVFRVRGFEYAFPGASREFAYVAPGRKATILVMEQAPEGSGYSSAEPVLQTAAFNALKKVEEFEFSIYNGRLLGDQYLKVFGGDNTAIRALGLEEGVSYLVMVMSEIPAVNQVELNGKLYDLYTTRGNGTTKIIRAADGVALYTATVQGVAGQGGDPDRAVIDGFRKTADKVAEQLNAELDKIRRTLLGG